MKYLKTLIFVLSLTAIQGLGFAEKSECFGTCTESRPASVVPEPRLISYSWMSLSRWYKMHSEDVAESEEATAKVVFYGDSITEGWNGNGAKYWKKTFAPMQAVNHGIGGDVTQNVLWRLKYGLASKMNPEKVICLIGTNNFGINHETPEQVAAGIEAVVDRIVELFPDAKLLVFSIFPRGETVEDPNRSMIDRTNELIKEIGERKNVTLMDIKDRFLSEDGSLSTEIMPDYLHLSEKGYAIWKDAIMEWVKQVDSVSVSEK